MPPDARRQWRRLRGLLVVGIAVLVFAVVAADLSLFGGGDAGRVASQAINDPDAPLARFFTPEVMHWQDEIRRWAQLYQINPNVIAIVIQIESCGSPEVLSWAGAVGLMQVMPYYFDNGENMLDPDTNVRHGMTIFKECLNVFADGQLGMAAACYNGGASVTQTNYANWPNETQHYHDWATRLWQDVVSGASSSEALDGWLQSGGARLCQIAAQDLFPVAVTVPTVAAGQLGGP